MSDFDWSGADADSVILPHQPRTAVYAGRFGNVVVRQEADAYEEHDAQLMFTPQGAIAIAWAMIERAREIGLPAPAGALSPAEREAACTPPTAALLKQLAAE